MIWIFTTVVRHRKTPFPLEWVRQSRREIKGDEFSDNALITLITHPFISPLSPHSLGFLINEEITMKVHARAQECVVVTEQLIQLLIIYSIVYIYESVYFIYGLLTWTMHLFSSQQTPLEPSLMSLTLNAPSPSLSCFPRLSLASLIPAWARLKGVSYASALSLWRQLFGREVFIMHFLRRLYLIWQDLIFKAKLKEFPPSTSFPSHNPYPKKGEKYVDFLFTWLRESHTGRDRDRDRENTERMNVLTPCWASTCTAKHIETHQAEHLG